MEALVIWTFPLTRCKPKSMIGGSIEQRLSIVDSGSWEIMTNKVVEAGKIWPFRDDGGGVDLWNGRCELIVELVDGGIDLSLIHLGAKAFLGVPFDGSTEKSDTETREAKVLEAVFEGVLRITGKKYISKGFRLSKRTGFVCPWERSGSAGCNSFFELFSDIH